MLNILLIQIVMLIIHLGRWDVRFQIITQGGLLWYRIVSGLNQLANAIVHPILILVLSKSILQHIAITTLDLLLLMHLLLI